MIADDVFRGQPVLTGARVRLEPPRRTTAPRSSGPRSSGAATGARRRGSSSTTRSTSPACTASICRCSRSTRARRDLDGDPRHGPPAGRGCHRRSPSGVLVIVTTTTE